MAARPVRPWLVVLAAASLSTAGCGLFGDPVEQRWTSRTEFASCGEVSLDLGEQMQQQAVQEIACLERALKSGESAELKVTHTSVEGDPVRAYYRVTPQGGLEVYTDSTDDRFSDRNWSFAECYSPVWLAGISCAR